MMLRVWMVGALAALPLLVSGALAQTPASSAGHDHFSRADDFSHADGQSDERAGLDRRPRQPVHAHAGVTAYGRS